MLSLPNRLTVARLLLIPIFIIFFYLPFAGGMLAAVIFAIAGATDWLDGYLARRLDLASDLGAFLDPVADKLLVAVALILLVAEPQLPHIALPAAVIVGREIVISALREWMAELGKRAHVAVAYIGKIKTLVQFSAILLLLVAKSGISSGLLTLGYITLYLAALLTIWSMMLYLRAALPFLKESRTVS